MIRSRRVAIQLAALSASCTWRSCAVQYVDLDFPLARRFSPSWICRRSASRRYTVAINLGGLIAVALLAGSLAESLRSAGARLEDASHQIRDLRAFNEYVINSLLSGLLTTDDEAGF